ncbi:MAG TPA: biotin/lipoyl-containing protein [Candidatus Limnocylindria bacterium]|nr:biotin/lipoyl-containing protein [Candidatus Limnocylindria bacterium]
MAPDNDERATITRLAEDVVPTLIARLEKSDLGEIEVSQDGWRVRLRRAGGDAPAPATHAAAASQPHKPAAVAHAADAQPRREPSRGRVSSPAVGYFSPRTGVAVGTKVRKGDIIGIVDMLGVRQEVVSPLDGVLKALDVESGQAVEFGQAIGQVEANV